MVFFDDGVGGGGRTTSKSDERRQKENGAWDGSATSEPRPRPAGRAGVVGHDDVVVNDAQAEAPRGTRP